jgi:4-hydroxythreonine-4-phosphate dehydrogenase
MKFKPIIIVGGEPNSVFLEILIKCLKLRRFKSPILLIISLKVFKLQLKKLNLRYNYRVIKYQNFQQTDLDFDKINILDIEYKANKAFEKISSSTNKYIEDCFNSALKIIKSGLTNKFINGPISKKYFLKNKFLGITEYLAKKTNTDNFAMLIYNKKCSVAPITTHLPLKLVSKNITKNLIIKKILLLNGFYQNYLNINPKIAITGLNPHCESIDAYNEDKKIIKPAVKYLKKKINITGPLPADTVFLNNNRKKYDLIVGMYHDQVLTPMKTLFEYDAINITIGLPFIRISPDHGPNESMMGKNLSNPKSLFEAIKFLDK